jgi:hypothetical protein
VRHGESHMLQGVGMIDPTHGRATKEQGDLLEALHQGGRIRQSNGRTGASPRVQRGQP